MGGQMNQLIETTIARNREVSRGGSEHGDEVVTFLAAQLHCDGFPSDNRVWGLIHLERRVYAALTYRDATLWFTAAAAIQVMLIVAGAARTCSMHVR